jgi:hypothetical protein
LTIVSLAFCTPHARTQEGNIDSSDQKARVAPGRMNEQLKGCGYMIRYMVMMRAMMAVRNEKSRM